MIATLSQVYLSQRLHNLSNINAAWTLYGTGIARCTLPKGVGISQFFSETKLGKMHHLPRTVIHLMCHRTHAAAGCTLHAQLYIFPTQFVELYNRLNRNHLGVNLQCHFVISLLFKNLYCLSGTWQKKTPLFMILKSAYSTVEYKNYSQPTISNYTILIIGET